MQAVELPKQHSSPCQVPFPSQPGSDSTSQLGAWHPGPLTQFAEEKQMLSMLHAEKHPSPGREQRGGAEPLLCLWIPAARSPQVQGQAGDSHALNLKQLVLAQLVLQLPAQEGAKNPMGCLGEGRAPKCKWQEPRDAACYHPALPETSPMNGSVCAAHHHLCYRAALGAALAQLWM